MAVFRRCTRMPPTCRTVPGRPRLPKARSITATVNLDGEAGSWCAEAGGAGWAGWKKHLSCPSRLSSPSRLSFRTKREEHVAGHAVEPRVAGVDVQHAAGDDGAGAVEGAAAAFDAVDGVVVAHRVDVPYDLAVGDGVRAKMSVARSGEDEAGNC